MSGLVPPAKPLQNLISLEDDISVMSKAKQDRYFLRQFRAAMEEYQAENDHGSGFQGLVNEHLHGTPAQKAMVLQMAARIMATEAATPEKNDGKIIDFPWLTRSRLAYKDPARLAIVRAENESTVVDVQAVDVKES